MSYKRNQRKKTERRKRLFPAAFENGIQVAWIKTWNTSEDKTPAQ